jgi:hypothetical protein
MTGKSLAFFQFLCLKAQYKGARFSISLHVLYLWNYIMDLEKKHGDSIRKVLTYWGHTLGIVDRVTGVLKFLIWFGITTQRDTAIKMCLKETYSKVCIGTFSFSWTVRNFGEFRTLWNNNNNNTPTSSSKGRHHIIKFGKCLLAFNQIFWPLLLFFWKWEIKICKTQIFFLFFRGKVYANWVQSDVDETRMKDGGYKRKKKSNT